MMKAIRGEPTERPPIWLMRQAGRYMAEYRAVREKCSFLDLCKNPKLAAEVMQTAVEKIGVDAAIIFSDLLPILEPMGFGLEFTQNDGPVIHFPFRSKEDLTRVREIENLDPLSYVFETVRETRRLIDPQKPVIGFAGAPFTLAGYAIEGGGSRDFLQTKKIMYQEPDIWNELLGRITRSVGRYLLAQVNAGANIVQIFDSWVGCLSVDDFQRFVFPHVEQLVQLVREHVPVIYFGTGNPALLPLFAKTKATVIGIDWRIPLDQAWEQIGAERAIQGNLDPAILLTNPDIIRREANLILDKVANRPGFIFNLGHGILKETPVENVIALVKTVHGE